MDVIALLSQLILIILIVCGSNYIYTLISVKNKNQPIKLGKVSLNRKSIIIVLYNFIIIGLFTIIYYNISNFSTSPQYLKDGQPHKLSLFGAMYECFITQTTVGFGDIEYNTNLVKFITMLQMCTLFINFGIITL